MFRDCPHRGEKVRIVHNVQHTEIVEDVTTLISPLIKISLISIILINISLINY
jgi:hypothetical protein